MKSAQLREGSERKVGVFSRGDQTDQTDQADPADRTDLRRDYMGTTPLQSGLEVQPQKREPAFRPIRAVRTAVRPPQWGQLGQGSTWVGGSDGSV